MLKKEWWNLPWGWREALRSTVLSNVGKRLSTRQDQPESQSSVFCHWTCVWGPRTFARSAVHAPVCVHMRHVGGAYTLRKEVEAEHDSVVA